MFDYGSLKVVMVYARLSCFSPNTGSWASDWLAQARARRSLLDYSAGLHAAPESSGSRDSTWKCRETSKPQNLGPARMCNLNPCKVREGRTQSKQICEPLN